MSNGLTIPDTLDQYKELREWVHSLRDRSLSYWEEAMRWYALNDTFFALNFVFLTRNETHSTYGTPFYFHEFYLKYCKQLDWLIENFESSFDGSARRGGKSTVRTRLTPIRMGLKYPNITQGIFSLERNFARKHMRGIKEELENNDLLKTLFPDRLWSDPYEAARRGECVWSLNDGFQFKGRTVPRNNQTIECNTFFGGPVGSGFDFMHFDDCEDGTVVSTPDNITKLHDAFDDAVQLATPVAIPRPVIWVTNTFYHPEGIAKKQYDKYRLADERKIRLEPGEVNIRTGGPGPMGGHAQYPFTLEFLQQKYDECKDKDEYAIQYCCDFTLGQSRAFKPSWVNWYEENPDAVMQGKYSYVCIDASRGVHDPMGIWVWSVGVDKRLFWTGGSRKKLDPASPAFADEIFNICAKVANLSEKLVEVRVEQMHSQTWAELIGSELRKRGMHVPVIPCRGKLANDRGIRKFETTKLEREWQRWSPPLQRGEIWFPKPRRELGPGLPVVNEQGDPFDLVEYFIDYEYMLFPRAPHDDMLDAGSLIWDPEVPPYMAPAPTYRKIRKGASAAGRRVSWMSA